MRYTYAYKTSDGTRHEDAMDAASREAVFESLRAKGIKAIKVVAADGSKANGEEKQGNARIWKWAVVALLLILSLASSSYLFYSSRPSYSSRFLANQTRRQVIGDAAVIEKGVRTGWADVFEHEGERFLASFAIPGVKAGQRTTTADELLAAISRPSPRATRQNKFTLEAEQIISMVEGMKAEARAYIKAGGSAVEYGKRLVERQEAEIAIYSRAESEIEAARKTLGPAAFERLLDERNDELRNLGIRPVVVRE